MSDDVVKQNEGLNSLSRAASAYLRSAQHQPIEWNEWGAEAFAKAGREQAGAAGYWRGVVPLVPCDGSREL